MILWGPVEACERSLIASATFLPVLSVSAAPHFPSPSALRLMAKLIGSHSGQIRSNDYASKKAQRAENCAVTRRENSLFSLPGGYPNEHPDCEEASISKFAHNRYNRPIRRVWSSFSSASEARSGTPTRTNPPSSRPMNAALISAKSDFPRNVRGFFVLFVNLEIPIFAHLASCKRHFFTLSPSSIRRRKSPAT
jgi:hypothetical protein